MLFIATNSEQWQNSLEVLKEKGVIKDYFANQLVNIKNKKRIKLCHFQIQYDNSNCENNIAKKQSLNLAFCAK